MSYLFYAPAFFTAHIMELPEPELGDGERLENRTSVGRSLSGVSYSFVISQPNRTYSWSFDLTRYKAIEFWHFYQLHKADLIRVDRNGEDQLVGYLKINPLVLEMLKRGPLADSIDVVKLEFEFETVQ